MAKRRLVLVREDRLGQWFEQRHEALDAVGQRPWRDRQPHVGQPARDPMQRPAADESFVEHARPDADPVGRGLEQPRHRRRGHLPRRGGAVATPAPARPHDGVLVGLDIDLEQSGAPLAVGGIGTPEVRRREDEIRAVLALDDAAMQVPQARPAVPRWQRQLRRRVNDGNVSNSFEELLVEVGRDEASAVFSSAQLDERFVNAQFTGWRCREPLDDRVPKSATSQPVRSFQ